jgi:hypothetical protein
MIYGLSAAVIRIQRLRAGQRVRSGRSALALVITLLMIVGLMCEVPYRIVSQSQVPRVDVANERCFLLGERDDDMLIHCPERTSPRNRIVKGTDADIHRLGLIQSIFDPPEAAR